MHPIQNSLDERLLAQARRMDHLTNQLRQQLPPECDGHYHVANIRQRTLVIITDSPAWTTRLRQLAPDIIAIVQRAGAADIQHVNVSSRVKYHAPRRQEPAHVKRSLSKQVSEHIDRSAEYINDDALKRALKKLARHRD